MKTAALILAAGSSKRLGQSKQLLDWGGRPLLEVVVKQVQAWEVDEVWVVLGHESAAILDGCDLERNLGRHQRWVRGGHRLVVCGLGSTALTRHSKACRLRRDGGSTGHRRDR